MTLILVLLRLNIKLCVSRIRDRIVIFAGFEEFFMKE
jgi:hypothetical protein